MDQIIEQGNRSANNVHGFSPLNSKRGLKWLGLVWRSGQSGHGLKQKVVRVGQGLILDPIHVIRLIISRLWQVVRVVRVFGYNCKQ